MSGSETIFSELYERPCQRAWRGYGPAIFFDFGKREEIDTFYGLCLDMCPWKISLNDETLATDDSSYEEMGAMLPRFEGQKIKTITISQDTSNTHIQFVNGLEITTNHSAESDQWYLMTPTEILEVGHLCKLKTEPRQEK